jgi:hypothetical protein
MAVHSRLGSGHLLKGPIDGLLSYPVDSGREDSAGRSPDRCLLLGGHNSTRSPHRPPAALPARSHT